MRTWHPSQPIFAQEGIVSIVRRSLQWLVVVVIAGGLLLSPHLATPAHALGATWYVATTGNDSNSCSSTSAPCKTINGAIVKTAAGDTVKVAVGTYTPAAPLFYGVVVPIKEDTTLSGGWNAAFTAQTGMSTIDGAGRATGIAIDYVSYRVTVTIDRFIIQNCLPDGWAGIEGGGIISDGYLTLTNSIVRNNTTIWVGGGGIYAEGSLTVENSTISNNKMGCTNGCSGYGGGAGIFVRGPATISNSTLSGNWLGGEFEGIAIFAEDGAVLNNTTVSGNTAYYAKYAVAGKVILNNSTVVNNYGGLTGAVSLRNSIVAGNRIDNVGANCHGPITSLGYNLMDIRNRDCGLTPTTGDKFGTPASALDARLGPLQDNGGPTFTHGLLPGSPAWNAGNPAVPGSGPNACRPTDQRGIARPVDARCDMGAFEGRLPGVSSITRLNASPSSAATVQFLVTFGEPVTGVNIGTASDFTLTRTYVTGAMITGLSGSGSVYTVTVNTGRGNGTIRLNLIDNDSIRAASGLPVGGWGAGNGTFTGPTYTISKIPVPRAPIGTIFDTTPTFKWTKVPRATTYQYQLFSGTTLVYSGYVSGKLCGTVCTVTPTATLPAGVYKWRVRALVDRAWKPYSGYKAFTLFTP